jgi:hypothetical protein
MTRRYEIDVVATHRLQLQHHVGEFPGLDFAAVPFLADVPVLAVHATEIAPAEKDRARAIPAAQRILLTMVWAMAVHDGPFTGSAYGTLDRPQPIHTAVTATEITILQLQPRFCNTSREFA